MVRLPQLRAIGSLALRGESESQTEGDREGGPWTWLRFGPLCRAVTEDTAAGPSCSASAAVRACDFDAKCINYNVI